MIAGVGGWLVDAGYWLGLAAVVVTDAGWVLALAGCGWLLLDVGCCWPMAHDGYICCWRLVVG